MRKPAGYTWIAYKTTTEITKELLVTSVLDKIQEYRRNWSYNVNRMSSSAVPRILNNCRPNGGRNLGVH
jgi:hypothetical protein